MAIKNNTRLLNGVLFIGLAAAVLSCGSEAASKQTEVETANSAPPAGETITTVEVSAVVNKNFEYLIQSNGKVRSQHEQLVTAESGGRILVCNAALGKRVHAGAVILQLETITVQHRLEKARLAQFNGLKEYESQLLGYENLLKDRTREEAEDIKQKLKISTGLSAAEQDIKEANYELSKANVRSPLSGVLADIKAQKGDQLRPGQELFRVYDPYNMLMETKVLEADIARIKTGTPVAVAPISDPGATYKGSIREIDPYVDENGMVMLRIGILQTNSGNQYSPVLLFPGMNCMAAIRVQFAKTLVVPKEAVVIRGGKAVVFTLEEGRAKWNYVTTGRDNGKEIEIKEGLTAGQKAIVTNNLQLANDAPIKAGGSGKGD